MAPMEEFIEMLKSHNRIVFFGGAGVSTESDIPDFRAKRTRRQDQQRFGPAQTQPHR